MLSLLRIFIVLQAFLVLCFMLVSLMSFCQDDCFYSHMESISFLPSLDVSIEDELLVKAVWYSSWRCMCSLLRPGMNFLLHPCGTVFLDAVLMISMKVL